jgi:hypothetical protein
MAAHNLYVEQHFGLIQNLNPQDPLLEVQPYTIIQEEDSLLEVLVRFWCFYVLVGKAAYFQPPVYGVPVDFYDQQVVKKPQVILHFAEPLANVEPTFQPVKARISFRIMKTPVAEITPAWASNFTIQIKELLVAEKFNYRKGQTLVTYKDPANGYDFQLYVSTEAEGIRVIEAILQLQEDAFDETKIVLHTSSALYPIVPPQQLVYGQERRAPRKRPVANVYFNKAELHLYGLPEPVVLVDLTGRSRKTVG